MGEAPLARGKKGRLAMGRNSRVCAELVNVSWLRKILRTLEISAGTWAWSKSLSVQGF